MAVLLDTSAGEIVIDLFVEECPIACRNFLSLCKLKYYNGCLFYNVQPNYIIQTGDPTGTGQGGASAYGIVTNKLSSCFADEIVKSRKLTKVGMVCMAHDRPNTNKSQFFITLRAEDLEHLEGQYSIFGEVSEGLETLEILNNLYCDESGRPYQDVRIRHTYILDDPLEEISGLIEPPASPTSSYPSEETVKRRIPFEESLDSVVEGRTEAEIEQSIKRKEAQSRAMVLEMTGDIPDIDAKPPVEVLFVCKLNSVTTDADLELIFSRFGKIRKCEIIRDFKTGDSLNYAFIEFDTEEACVQAYEKMNNVLIDDRRIKVDFSQSVSHLWNKYLMKPRQALKSKPATTSSVPSMGASGSSSGTIHIVGERSRPAPKTEQQQHGEGNRKRSMSRSRSADRRDKVDSRDHKERDQDRRHQDQRRDYDRKSHRGDIADNDRIRRNGSGGERDRDRDSRRAESRTRDRSRERYRDNTKERYRDRSRERERNRDRSRDRHNDRYHRS